MRTKTRLALHEFFSSLSSDLEIGVAYSLADKYNLSPAQVFSEYEAWQLLP